VREEAVERTLAIVRLEGFQIEEVGGSKQYVTEIVYPKDKEALLVRSSAVTSLNPAGFGFHYDPYRFASSPERSFFEEMLNILRVDGDDVEDIYFTGGLTDPGKTDFYVWYRDPSGKWRRYFPDFVIRQRPTDDDPAGSGRVLIVEIKAENEREHPVNGDLGLKAQEVRKLAHLNKDRIRYEMIFTRTDAVSSDGVRNALADFVAAKGTVPSGQ
jgi:type III restriction enzyme